MRKSTIDIRCTCITNYGSVEISTVDFRTNNCITYTHFKGVKSIFAIPDIVIFTPLPILCFMHLNFFLVFVVL